MKKNIYIVLFGLLLSMGVVSCDNNTDLLFDESAAQRKTTAITEYNEALKSADQGWLFQYFPEETQKYGGYNYVVKFNQHDSVTVWSELMPDVTKPEISFYDVISYGGPVLTFNTYNPLMHYFANPSAQEYLAKGGDYEFLIMSNEKDVMTVKGIKTGNIMRMVRMTETFDEYFKKTQVVSDFLSGASLGTLIDGTEVNIILGGRQLILNYSENDEVISETVAFIYTDKGIRLYEEVDILGITAQDFTLNTEAKQLVSTDGKMTIDIAFAPVDLTLARWSFDTSVETDRSAAIKEVWDLANDADAKAWGESLYPNIFMGLCYAAYGDIGISMYSVTPANKMYRSHYNLGFGGVVGHDDYLSITKLSSGQYWQYYGHFQPIVNVVVDNAPYKVELDDANNPSVVKLTSVANPDVWFVLRK
ncbi:DUF4302 domain-containing protein [Labilibaculum euxinus]